MSAENYGYVISASSKVSFTNTRYRGLNVFRTKKEAQEFIKRSNNYSKFLKGRYPRVVKATKTEYRSALRGDKNDRGMVNFFNMFRMN